MRASESCVRPGFFSSSRFVTYLLISLMAISETSYRDREGKSQSLRDTTAGFTPVFAPADISLNATNFQTFIGGVSAANTNVETLAINYTNNSTARIALVKSVRAAVTQAVNYVKSNKAWATQFNSVKMAADKMRGMSPPTKVVLPPPPAPGEPPAEAAKARSKGEQAYVELAAHLEQFITAISACTPYAPPSAAITINTFSAALSQFKGLNGFISTLDTQLTSAREARAALYYTGDSCLERKFQEVKAAVLGQYGQSSSQYGAVKSMKW